MECLKDGRGLTETEFGLLHHMVSVMHKHSQDNEKKREKQPKPARQKGSRGMLLKDPQDDEPGSDDPRQHNSATAAGLQYSGGRRLSGAQAAPQQGQQGHWMGWEPVDGVSSQRRITEKAKKRQNVKQKNKAAVISGKSVGGKGASGTAGMSSPNRNVTDIEGSKHSGVDFDSFLQELQQLSPSDLTATVANTLTWSPPKKPRAKAGQSGAQAWKLLVLETEEDEVCCALGYGQ